MVRRPRQPNTRSRTRLTPNCWVNWPKSKFDHTTPELRDNILQFYSDLSVPIETKKDEVRWQGVLTALDQLKSVAPAPTLADRLAQ